MTSPLADLRREIRDHPLFQGMDPGFLEALEPSVVVRSIETGELIIREGSPAHALLLVTHGKIGLEMTSPDRPPLSLLTVGPGEIVGWSWLLPPHRWQVDGRALKPTRVLAIDGPVLRGLLDSRPKDGYRFLLRIVPIITGRLHSARVQVMDIHAV